LAMMVSYTRFNKLAFVSSLFILGIPLFDLAYVSILRIMKGRMPFWGSPDHFALRLRKKKNWSSRQTVSAIVLLQLFLSGSVIINFFSTPKVTMLSSIVFVCFFLVLGLVLAGVKME
jgi:UDP-N-acetylmuramyl pentapeptide phosphotransferase/UDP-N-acetylglucosamine-1-phosphate transferase